MGHLCITIGWVEEETPQALPTQLSRLDLPPVDFQQLPPAKALDALEQQTLTIGHEIMRELLIAQWEIADQQQVEAYRDNLAPEVVKLDGYDSQRIACRLGILHLPRQVCFHEPSRSHTMPGNALLPEHHGTIITRGLQEWACLLPQDLPFATVQRLLGWQAQQADVISTNEVRVLVRRHGQRIRAAEAEEVERLEEIEDLSHLQANLVAAPSPRRCPAWPPELNAAVEQALAEPEPTSPDGVSQQDWKRVLQARAQEKEVLSIEQLRRLGPEIQLGQTIAAADDVGVRRPERSRWLSLRVARVATQKGYRYLSGTGTMVLKQLFLLLVLCGGLGGWVTLLGDGAKWLREFFEQCLSPFAQKELLLDWYHLHRKCSRFASMICPTRQTKRALLKQLSFYLWRGQVESALAALEATRPQTKNSEKLQELIDYLTARQPYIVNYEARRRQRQYIGSAHAEKACDLIVARRQKNQGMHWSEQSADGLAALKTLRLNQGWELYWLKHQVLSIAIPA